MNTTDRYAMPRADALAPELRLLGELRCRLAGDIGDDAIARALDAPHGPDGQTRGMPDVVSPGERVCIVVSDYTRCTGADRVLPVLVERLTSRGVREDDITLLVACGIHRPPDANEIRNIVGTRIPPSIRSRVLTHDPDDDANLVRVGTTQRGHPVRINRAVVDADCVILTGAATYHYHAGFGGGRKSLVPGVASRDTIAFNHSLTLSPDADQVHPRVAPGILDGNPVAMEMLESARMCSPDLIINTVMSPSGEMAAVFAGDLDVAHRAACRAVEAMCRFDIDERADLVIASVVGAPNWIQSHKGLFNASRALREGGRIVLLAPCPEGIGNERFRDWVSMSDSGQLFAALRQSPEILGQTALSTRTRGRSAILVSDMSAAESGPLGMQTADSVEAGVAAALDELRRAGHDNPSVMLMPEARYTVPFPRS